MELPDCPPGAEGYEDSVIEVPKKPNVDEAVCTKAEQEFQDHLNSLKIKVEDDVPRCMVERRGRDVSGKWIYLCYPCAAVCSGESILQTHISGKKHKTKLAIKSVWPKTIFEEHPFILSEKGTQKSEATEKILQKMAEEVNLHKNTVDLETKFSIKYRNVRCHIQDSIDTIKAPLIGLEYLVEHPPEEENHEPSYLCTLCNKQGHPRTIINHLTCFWHRFNYLTRHFTKASSLLDPYKSLSSYREAVSIIINRLVQRIEDKYGRLKPVNIEKEEFEKDRDRIHRWLFKSYHVSEKDGPTYEEVVDVGLIESLQKANGNVTKLAEDKKEPSPPVVAAPSRPLPNNSSRVAKRQEHERQAESLDALSDISDEPDPRRDPSRDAVSHSRNRYESGRYEPYRERRRESPSRMRYSSKSFDHEKIRPPNYEYKKKLVEEQLRAAEDAAKKTLAYHEKNPEKHPLYPEEWKKFWNRRYKEIQAEGEDPSKHDFKPEWIQFWTTRMKELHEAELRVNVSEIYRRMCLSPPSPRDADSKRLSPDSKRRSPERRGLDWRAHDHKRRSSERRIRDINLRRRSPDLRRRSPDHRRRSPDIRRRSPDYRRRSPDRRRTDDRYRRDHRSSPLRGLPLRQRSRSPFHRRRSPHHTNIVLESSRRSRSRSPLSRRDAVAPLRNRSPAAAPQPAPSLQTVLISDDELKPDDGLSPWNSGSESLGSLPEVRSPAPRAPRRREFSRPAEPADLGPAENVVATLRLLVALEDYLGSLGPKIVDLLTDALKMEKEKANSSEELLERESAVVLLETAKEKLKGAVQAGLVGAAAAPALRTAVVRVAATLHEADRRARALPAPPPKATKKSALPVAGVGEVDRAQIAQQMAAALVAQGKTDVSSEELAQLVDAVVGMAEAKKREARERQTSSGPASALQMLQSAYDENEKRDREEAPDAMDGLSDSDLETLLKNFNELSAEEQHSLIAYLKKLESKEPLRVERLRQYVNAAACTAASVSMPALAPRPTSSSTPAPATTSACSPAPTPPASAPAPIVPAACPAAPASAQASIPSSRAIDIVKIESEDDDDYTVEEVFKSATQKVKEDQMRQEMEVVKKSLEESKALKAAPTNMSPAQVIDLANNLSSATDLLALVQASMKPTVMAIPSAVITSGDVVTSNTHPRSYGDLPESTITQTESSKPLLSNPSVNQQALSLQGGLSRSQQISMDYGENRDQSYNPGNWNHDTGVDSFKPDIDYRGLFGLNTKTPEMHGFAQGQSMHDQKGPMLENRGPTNDKLGHMQEIRGAMQDNREPTHDNRGLFQDSRGAMQDNAESIQEIKGPIHDNIEPKQDNRSMQDNRGPRQYNRGSMLDNRGPMQDNRGSIQVNRGPMQDNRGFMQDNRGPMQDNRGFMQDNRGTMQDNRGFMQDNRGPMQDNRGPMQDNRGFMQDNWGSMPNQLMPDNRSMPLRCNIGYNMQNIRGPMHGNRAPLLHDNVRPPLLNIRGQHMNDIRGNYVQDNRASSYNNGAQESYNQGPRSNFMNGRMQENSYGNQQNQQFANFRGRGVGRGARGRGRGFF